MGSSFNDETPEAYDSFVGFFVVGHCRVPPNAKNDPAETFEPTVSSHTHSGYTLVELMVSLAVTGIILAAVCLAFGTQQKISAEQGLAVGIMQNARAALSLLQHDIRMAGYDPTWSDANDDGRDDQRIKDTIDNDCDGRSDQDDPGSDEHRDLASFINSGPHYLQFRLDRLGDGDFCDAEDLIGFGFSTARDRNRDGVADAGAAPLGRSVGASGLQPLVEDIQAVAFGYAFDDDNGAALTDGAIDQISGHILWGYDGDNDGYLDTLLDSNNDGNIGVEDDLDGDGRINDIKLTPEVPVHRIRAVAVWLLTRANAPLRTHRDMTTYVVGDKIITPNDRYKRELMTTIVHCRNLGLR